MTYLAINSWVLELNKDTIIDKVHIIDIIFK